MAGEAYPIDVSSGSPSYTSAEMRQIDSALLLNGTADAFGARGGSRPGAGMVVSAASLAWAVTAGAFIAYPRFSASQGPYRVTFPATENGSYNSPHATFSRRDILSVVIDDAGAGDGSGARQARIVYTAGTASASPVSPSVPARGTLLATIVVPPAGSPTIIQGQFAVAAGGVLPVADATEAGALTKHDGMLWWRSDTDAVWGYSGSADVFVGGKQQRAWETFRSTNPATTSGYAAGSYIGLVTQNLPSTAPAGRYSVTFTLTANAPSNTGGSLRVLAGATNLSNDCQFPVGVATNMQTFRRTFVHTGGSLSISASHNAGAAVTLFDAATGIVVEYLGPE